MKPVVSFNPGPSQIYFTVEDHIRKAFKIGIPSISHRSKTFENIFSYTVENLKNLLLIPPEWHILFTSSATEIWERSIQNLVETSSHHLVNGAFSKKYYEFSRLLGKSAAMTELPYTQGFSNMDIPGNTELIAITQNETSIGVAVSNEFISALRKDNPSALIIVDAVSSLPYPSLDYSKVDSIFFSVQKGFGLPAGLGVWMINERCLEKANYLISKNGSLGTYHTIPNLVSYSKRNQTPSTPNVLAIYLLGQVCNDFLRRGLKIIRKEIEYKAAILYQALDNHPSIKPFVTEKAIRSNTVIVADTGQLTQPLASHLMENKMYPGEGYGVFKGSQLRFANFPAHSKEIFEKLCDLIASFG